MWSALTTGNSRAPHGGGGTGTWTTSGLNWATASIPTGLFARAKGGMRLANGNLGGTLSVSSGATLMGSDTVGTVTIHTNATLSPSTGPGTITTGNTTWEGDDHRQVFDTSHAAGTRYDTVSRSGTLTISATSGNPFKTNLWPLIERCERCLTNFSRNSRMNLVDP